MTDDIIRKATTADYIETIDNLRAEVERLRAALAHELDLRNRHIESLEARIKELEALNESLMENGNDLRARCWKAEARIKELEAENERLEAAFLEAKRDAIYFQDAPNTRMMLVDLWDVADKKAREALEIIKEGGKDE